MEVPERPFKLSESPVEVDRPPPMIGQHNREVLVELLGLSLQEVEEDHRDGILWPKEMPMYPYMRPYEHQEAAR